MIRRFIDALFQNKDPEHYILVWRLRDHVSTWFTDPEKAAVFLFENKDEDMYVGAGLASADMGAHARATEDKVVALAGFYADVDFQSDVDKPGKRRPPREIALELLQAMPLFPSMIIDTGHGYHGWWLFKEPHAIDSPEELARVKSIARGWATMLQGRAKQKGYDIDSVFDLARVMRAPGTMNCKDKQHCVEAKIESEYDTRFAGPGEVEQFLPDGWQLEEETEAAVSVSGLVVNASAEPPFERYEALRNNDDKFRLSCDRKRRGMGDNSASGYDMSLAAIAVYAGWTDQEICDLMIAMRRRAGEDMKLNRPEYYARTITKARTSVAQNTALESLATTNAEDEDARKKVCDALGGLEIQRIVRYATSDGGTYYIVAKGQHVPIGGIDQLMNQRTFLNRVADVTGFVRSPIKAFLWWQLAQLIRDMAEDEDFGEEGSESGLMRTWLMEYLDGSRPSSDRDTSVAAKAPFIENGEVYVCLSKVADYVEYLVREKRTRTRLRVSMRTIGAKPLTVSATVNGRRTTRGYWKLPSDISGAFKDLEVEEPVLATGWPK